MPWLKAQPDSVANTEEARGKRVVRVHEQGRGQETEPETHSEDGSEGVSPENCLGTSANQGRGGGGQCWAKGLIPEV